MKRLTGIYLLFATVFAMLLVFANAEAVFAEVKPCVGVEVRVLDENNQPVLNEPVVLMAEGIGYQVAYTDNNGDAVFDTENWPNECEDPYYCCPADHNAGEYFWMVYYYCNRQDFTYDGGFRFFKTNIRVDRPCR